jgi:hypothetical protein
MRHFCHYPTALLAAMMALLALAGCAPSAATGEQPLTQEIRLPAGESPARFVEAGFLTEQVGTLSSDSLKGRGTGQPGSAMTADYLESFYSSLSIPDNEPTSVQRQPFELEGIFWDSVHYEVYAVEAGDTLFHSRSYLEKGGLAHFYPLLDGARDHDAPVVFAGHARFDDGDEISGTIGAALRNNWVMVFAPDPEDNRSRTGIVRELNRNYGALGVVFITDHDPGEWELKAEEMSRQLERPRMIRRPGERYRASERRIAPAVSIHPELASGILGLSHPEDLDSLRYYWQQDASFRLPEHTGFRLRNTPVLASRSFEEHNIIAVIPGADENLSREAIVLSAHYDHMGLGEPDESDDIVYSGADDNASGTAALMQVARAFHDAALEGYRPSRTLVFLHVAAEEWGLFGSRYFMENQPLPHLEIVSNLNVDMVGYVDDVYARREEQGYVYVIGAGMVSTLLEELVLLANEATSDLVLDEMYNSTSHYLQLYRRSDHWPFAQRNIPFVFFFSGLHEHYHRPSDTADRIAGALLADRVRLITELTWYLAESPVRPETDRKKLGTQPVPAR